MMPDAAMSSPSSLISLYFVLCYSLQFRDKELEGLVHNSFHLYYG